VAACPDCGSENAEGANFCSVCGARLGADEAERAELRKTVSIVFCDLTGSTDLGERLDPESLRKVMARYFEAMRGPLERHGGSVEKFIGDAVMAVFGIPQLHEDDALRAVRAAADMRTALERLNGDLERDHGVRLACRIGVNTGEVIVGTDQTDFGRVTGDAVNTAARLEAAAEPGEILIGVATQRLVRNAVETEDVEPLTLKGKAEPVPAFRLLAVAPGTGPPPRALRSPMVGRDRELDDLRRAFARAADDRACVLFTVVGAPGEGKSRLIEEFLGWIQGTAGVVTGRCLPYGEGITYWPVAEAVRAALGVRAFDPPAEVKARLDEVIADDEHADAIARRISEVLGAREGVGSAEELPWAIRRFLEILAADGPLVTVWEDIHWAEPAFLDLVDHLVDWSREAPILVVCSARPEFLDARASWGGGKPNATTLSLQPLDEKASAELIGNLLGGTGLPADVSERINETAGGNPLFVEQMLSMMIDDGQLVAQDGGWSPEGDVTAVQVPPSVAALLAARLERLSEDERRTIECASVIGREFYRGAVAELLPESIRPRTDDLVLSLVRKGFARRERSPLPGQEALRFHHILIRDAAYTAIPKERRADLHEAFAHWIDRIGGERAEEADEIVGYHLEQAFLYRSSLSPLDDHARDVGHRASERLAAAGRRALDRHDMQAVSNLLGRAQALLDPADPDRLNILPDLGIALWNTGRIDGSRATLAEALTLARELGDREMVANATLAGWYGQSETKRSPEEARADAQRAIEVFEKSENDRGLARAWQLVADRAWDLGHAAEQLEALDRGLEHAERSGDSFEIAELLASVTSAIVRGPMPVTQAIARVEEILREHRGNRTVESYMFHALGHLQARLGDLPAARASSDRYRAFLLDTGQQIVYLRSSELRFDVEMLAGDPEAACAVAEESYAQLLDKGDRWPYLAAFLAQARFRLGRYEDAAEVAGVAASSMIPVERALGLGVLARLRARSGDADAARDAIREAVSIVEETDFLFDRGTVFLDQGDVLGELGATTDARSALERALAAFEAKGDVVSSARARALLER
jgi:class 3 adenylate cyclase/tetratricopeptide (TPR) repeat protein